MAIKNGWLRWAVGEISKLRTYWTNFSIKISSLASSYKLDSSKVNYELARQLYDNTHESYKLGAGFCKRIINAKLGFMGVPAFLSDDPNAQQVLDGFFKANISQMSQTMKKALIEGKAIVWITREETDAALYPETRTHLVYNLIPNEQLTGTIRDPLTRKPKEYVFQYQQEWYDDAGNLKHTSITRTISAQQETFEQTGDIIPDLPKQKDNPWGFIPIVVFHNEPDVTREEGQSEFEPIEPFLKAYHDLLFKALQGSHMHSTPRLKFNVKDVAAFLRNNFGIDDPVKFAQEGKTISLDGKEFLIFGEGEDAGFIEVRSGSGNAEPLLKLLFYCIVDASETPEFVFGVHTPSALSSVKEQMPAFIRNISRKRDDFSDAWQRLARIVLAMTAQAEMTQYTTYAVTLDWAEIDPRDEKEVAETINQLCTGLKTAVDGQFLSTAAAAQFLKDYIPTMLDYADDPEVKTERDRILVHAIERSRMEDGAFNLNEIKANRTELASSSNSSS